MLFNAKYCVICHLYYTLAISECQLLELLLELFISVFVYGPKIMIFYE